MKSEPAVDVGGFFASQLVADILNYMFMDCDTLKDVDRLEVLDSVNEELVRAQLPLLECGLCTPFDAFEVRLTSAR